MAFAGESLLTHYPDFTVSVLGQDRLTVDYRAEYNDDFSTLNRASKHTVDGREVWGRSFIVGVPSDGDAQISYTYQQAGENNQLNLQAFAPSHFPLVIRQSSFYSRGHKLVRFIILAQRAENSRVVAYNNFSINVTITGNTTPLQSPVISRLDRIASDIVINPDQFLTFQTITPTKAAFKPVLTGFDDSSQWVKIVVREDGVFRVTAGELQQAGISLTALSSDSLRLFYAGGEIAPPNFSDPQPELNQVPVRVIDGGDGLFGGADYLQFYGQGPSRYDYDGTEVAFKFNAYSDNNVYWLAVGGQAGIPVSRWQSVMSSPGSPDETLTSFNNIVRVEQENQLKIDGDGHTRNYYRWYHSDQTTVSTSTVLPDLDVTAADSIDIELSALCDFNGTSIILNGSVMIRAFGSGTSYHYLLPSSFGVSGLNSVQITLRQGINGSYTDFLNIAYPQSLLYHGSQLAFSSYKHSGNLQYSVDGYVSGMEILDITNPDAAAILTGLSISGSNASFNRSTGSGISRFVAFSTDNVKAPASISLWQGENLLTDVTQYDCVVISPRFMQDALGEYVSYRNVNGGHRVKLAAVEDIYDLFGFGQASPQAIRGYLKFAYENFTAPAPFAALLVGDGHYDFKDNLGLHLQSYIPPFIWEVEFSAGDDNFVYFGDVGILDSDSTYVPDGDRGWDMMTGRWPVRSSSEVRDYIDKIKIYESPESQGIWRSRITFVADDEFKGSYSSEIIHTAQAETLAVLHTPPEIRSKKIYATDYPFASNGDKPTVNSAIVNALNEGSLIINYTGHGSPDVWADEHIFQKSADLGRLNNTNKPTAVIAGSCSIGKFDIPGKEGMAEMLFRMQGGAISTISATRLVYSRDNAIFSYDLYDAIFGGAGNFCEAIFAAKMLHQYEHPGFTNLLRNDRSYVVFGDPLGFSSLPEYQVDFEVDGGSLLTPLEYFGFSGQIIDEAGAPVVYDGQVTIDVYDSRFVRHHPQGIDYTIGGPQIFRGELMVTGGQFSGGFIVPLDIDYGAGAAQISGYSNLAVGSALGIVDSIAIAESAGTTTDNTGPEIEFSFTENPDFQSGDRISTNAELIIDLTDESGINLTGGLGHRIELIIDGDNNTTQNLTEYFGYEVGSYRSGSTSFILPDLTPELHTFTLKAWDNANNPSIVEFEAMAALNSRITLQQVMNYPSPMEDYTEFFFDLSESAEWAELQIFTLAGRNVKSLRESNLHAGKNRRFLWNGRDLDGDRVAEGVYLYKITVKGRVISGNTSSDNITETFGKLVLLN